MKKEFKDLFPNLDICKKFKEMGLFEESLHCYCQNFKNEPFITSRKQAEIQEQNLGNAPSVLEMLELLPSFVTYKYNTHLLYISKDKTTWEISYDNIYSQESEVTYDRCFINSNTSLAICLGNLILSLKEKGII